MITSSYDATCTTGTIRPLVFKMSSSLVLEHELQLTDYGMYGYGVIQLSDGTYGVAASNPCQLLRLAADFAILYKAGGGDPFFYDTIELPGLSQTAYLGQYNSKGFITIFTFTGGFIIESTPAGGWQLQFLLSCSRNPSFFRKHRSRWDCRGFWCESRLVLHHDPRPDPNIFSDHL